MQESAMVEFGVLNHSYSPEPCTGVIAHLHRDEIFIPLSMLLQWTTLAVLGRDALTHSII